MKMTKAQKKIGKVMGEYKEGIFYLLKEHDQDKYWMIQPDVIQIFEVKEYQVREVFQSVNPLGYIPCRHTYGMVPTCLTKNKLKH